MSSSGTYNFQATNGQLLISSFERIGVHAPSLRQEHMVTARQELNYLFVEFSNKGVNLWKVTLTSLPMVSGTATYSVPANIIMILDAYISVNQGSSNQTDLYITPVSRTEYASYANKQTQGRPTSFWLNRQINPIITMWPVPDSNVPYTLNYYSFVQLQDANLAGGETPDIPYRWTDAIVAGLSYRLARVYKPELEAVRKVDAKEAWITAASQDTENISLSLAPTIKSYYRR